MFTVDIETPSSLRVKKKKEVESNTSTDLTLTEHIFNLLKTKLKAEGITKRQLQETRGVT